MIQGWAISGHHEGHGVAPLPAETAHRDAGEFGHLDEGETEYSGGVEDGGSLAANPSPAASMYGRGQQLLAAGSDRPGQSFQRIRGVETPGTGDALR